MKKILRILAYTYLGYLAFVLVIVTPALNLVPAWAVEKYLGRQLDTEFVWFNPFTLSLEMRKTELPEHSGERFVGFERATVDLSTASIWSGALVFDELSVNQLYVHIIELASGDYNFTDMLPPGDAEEPTEEADEVFPLTVELLHFNAQQLIYSSEARETPFSTHLNAIDITVHGVSTVIEDGEPYTLDATGENGGTLHWEGHVSIPRAYSDGTLTIHKLQLHPLWRFAQPWVGFDLAAGSVSIDGHYKVDWNDDLKYWVSQGEVRLDELAMRPGQTQTLPDTGVSIGSIKLAGIALDGPARAVDMASLEIGELAISGWMEGEQVSLVDLFAVTLPEDDAPAPEDDEAAPWTATLAKFDLADSTLRWRSQYTEPAQLEVTPISASASAIRWPLEGDSGLSLNLTVNGQTTATIEGTLDLGTGGGELAYQLSALPLPWFNPNLPPELNAAVTAGELQVAGDVTLSEFAPVTIAADGAITGFAGKITDSETSFTAWETVRWDKLRVEMDKHRVELAKLSIVNYTGRIHINKDGSINAANVWKEQVGEQAQEVADTLAEGDPWIISAPAIQISDSEIDFMDESLPIHFRTVIGDINGDIKDISTQPGVKTHVQIKGSVDGYAPVALSGTAEPLRDPLALDLELTFDGVDMALLSPYSGTYAGYDIERGVLNLDLKYAMEDNKLKGHNKIVIDQMKLGDKVDSDKAVDLPLELALALLTDSKGVIDMEIPVSGNVDNPEFNVGSVVMGALVNLITKAVTAPFNLLANLVGSEEDLQRVSFRSGSAMLNTASQAKLDDLQKALQERPELTLLITGRLQLKADREGLQKNGLRDALLEGGLSAEELKSKGPAWEQAVQARYQAMTPGETTLTVHEQYQALADTIAVTDEALLALGAERAKAVKTYLVNTAGLSPDRAAIANSNLNTEKNRYSGVELAIEI